MVLPEKSMEILIVFGGALLILLAVIALGSATGLLKAPEADFFAFLGRMFFFLEQQVGLAGKETADMFCQKDLQDAIELCKISAGQLSDYCSMDEYEQAGVCQDPPGGMKEFCKQPPTEKAKICKRQNEFNSGCEAVNAQKDAKSTKDLPFCK
ncbi:MAG: hypothetical protein QXD77_00040 [Candidatus Aenigmatarchaeota archaeon]